MNLNLKKEIARFLECDPEDLEKQMVDVRVLAAAPDLLAAAKGALAALSQNKTFPADINTAKAFLIIAIEKAEGK